MQETFGDVVYGLIEVTVPIAVNAAIAWWLGLAGFLRWYLIAATGSSLALTLAAMFAPLDEHEGIISPSYFVFRSEMEDVFWRLYAGWVPPVGYVRRPALRRIGALTEWLAAKAITAMASLLMIVWDFVLGPMVYPLYAVFGAPARVAGRSPGAVYWQEHGSPDGLEQWTLTPNRSDLPHGAKEYSIANRPVTFTALLTTVILWIALQVAQVV